MSGNGRTGQTDTGIYGEMPSAAFKNPSPLIHMIYRKYRQALKSANLMSQQCTEPQPSPLRKCTTAEDLRKKLLLNAVSLAINTLTINYLSVGTTEARVGTTEAQSAEHINKRARRNY